MDPSFMVGLMLIPWALHATILWESALFPFVRTFFLKIIRGQFLWPETD
jgi:hypothetical protein